MSEPDSPSPSERSSAPGAWHSSVADGDSSKGVEGRDPPTVRTGGSSVRPKAGSSITPIPLPMPGDQIDSFILEESIGVGGMGAVFRAQDTKLDRHVALKILPPEQSKDSEVVQRFYQEGRAAARLDHENIARVFTIGHDGPIHFIAFEYIEGTTIRQRVEQGGPLSVSEAINYTLQIASALVHASERGVVHRDIKPSNIIVSHQGRAKLVDMGLARRFERGGDDGLTQSGMTLGTFDYISPEQARDPRDVDVRSDLYSLGCTLFHMLTGRPPFPDGTVLQKLIQHQEETPPSVRALNPHVPVELANVLSKLMAKERERRYQTPEQLVRDLLLIAGSLGLRSVSPEGLVWMSASRPPAWERHLVWGFPVLAFALLLLALFWWGQDSGSTSVSSTFTPAPPRQPATDGSKPTGITSLAITPKEDGIKEAAAPSYPAMAREIAADSGDNLLDVLAKAPPRAVITLNDNGPYELGLPFDRTGTVRLLNRDLTLKAAAGVRPVLRVARDTGAGSTSPTAILDFDGGVIILEGLTFELDPGDREGMAALRTDGTDLTVRRCVFRCSGSRGSHLRSTALHVRAKAAGPAGELPPPVLLEACHIESAQLGVLGSGPADIELRDCTLAASGTALAFENRNASGPSLIEVRLIHDSIVAGLGPICRFEGVEPRIQTDSSILAAGRDHEATLIAADDPSRIAWKGRANLYGRIGVYLEPIESRGRFEPVRDSTRWAESLTNVRETGSSFAKDVVWEEPDPSLALASESSNPSRAFRVASSRVDRAELGARQGPFGALLPTSRLVAVSSEKVRERPAAITRTEETRPPDSVNPPSSTLPAPMPAAPETSAPATNSGMPEVPVMPPMKREEIPTPATETEPARAETVPASAKPNSTPPTTAASSAANSDRTDASLIQTAEQFRVALNQAKERGAVMRVAAEADLELNQTAIDGEVHWIIRAEPGNKRPILRLRPSAAASVKTANGDGGFELPSGTLQIEGFDIIVPRPSEPREGRWAAFSLGYGAELSLTNCTVTMEGESADSPAFLVRSGDLEAKSKRVARLRFTDCLLRAGGDLIDVASGLGVEVDLNNALVATGGSVLHAHGAPRVEGGDPPKLEIELRQVTVMTTGGLVFLDSDGGEPELPIANVSARDLIVAMPPDSEPLLRVDGQDPLVELRNRINWKGYHVAYHQISVYRRDQSAQIGSVPNTYDRPSWTNAVGPNEVDPIHGDLKFLHGWDPERSAWSLNRDDMKLSSDSPVRTSGADLPRVPAAPPGS